jgi:RNA polymerase sigma factor (sigma-70 family)
MVPFKDKQDRDLANALLLNSQDPAAWLHLYRKVGAVVIRAGMDRGLRHVEAEEALQETMISFHRELLAGKFDPERGDLVSWILHIAKWRIIDQFRRRTPEERMHADVEEEILSGHLAPEVDPGIPPPSGCDPREGLEIALEKLKALINPAEFDIFTALAFGNQDGQTVAERHGLTRNAVYLHKRHALHKLEQLLRGEI